MFTIKKSVKASGLFDGGNVVAIQLENLCACPAIATRIVCDRPVDGAMTVKVKMNLPYRVAYASNQKGTEYLENAALLADPVIHLREMTEEGMYVSEVVGANQYFEKVFQFDAIAVKEGTIFVLASQSDQVSFEGMIVIDVDLNGDRVNKGRNDVIESEEVAKVGEKRRGGRPKKY